MAIGWALLTALGFGIGDFLAGVASRRTSALWVAALSSSMTGILLLVLAVFVAGELTTNAIVWGGATGAALAIGLLAYYVGFARGGFGLVSAVTGVWSALVPLVVGLALGERPGWVALCGVALLVAAIALVSDGQGRRLPVHGIVDPEPASRSGADAPVAHPGWWRRSGRRLPLLAPGLVEATIGGIAFGLVFVFLGQARDGHPVWPVAVSILAAAAILLAAVVLRRPGLRLSVSTFGLVLGAGLLQAGATLAFVLAVREGYLSIVAVAGAMSPIPTAAAAWLVLRERLAGIQKWGFGSAMLGILLIALS